MRGLYIFALLVVPFQAGISCDVVGQEVVDDKVTFQFEGQNCTYIQRYTVERRDTDSSEYLVTHSLRELFDKKGKPAHSSLSTYGIHERPLLSEVLKGQGKVGKKLDMLYTEPTLYFLTTFFARISVDQVTVSESRFRGSHRLADVSYRELGLLRNSESGVKNAILVNIVSGRIDDVSEDHIKVTLRDENGQVYSRSLPVMLPP